MSAKTIFDNDFEFKNLHLNKLQFSDNSIQTTAYLGNSPLPTEKNFDISQNTDLSINFVGFATIQQNINILNLHTGFIGVLYFQDASLNNINSFNLTFFSSGSNIDLKITILNSVNFLPYKTSSFPSSILNTITGELTFGNIIINNSGSLVASFNNFSFNNTSIYTLNVYSCLYA